MSRYVDEKGFPIDDDCEEEKTPTDNEIIKALECCKSADCLHCPRWTEEWQSGMCRGLLLDALSLISRQKAELATVRKRKERWRALLGFSE